MKFTSFIAMVFLVGSARASVLSSEMVPEQQAAVVASGEKREATAPAGHVLVDSVSERKLKGKRDSSSTMRKMTKKQSCDVTVGKSIKTCAPTTSPTTGAPTVPPPTGSPTTSNAPSLSKSVKSAKSR